MTFVTSQFSRRFHDTNNFQDVFTTHISGERKIFFEYNVRCNCVKKCLFCGIGPIQLFKMDQYILSFKNKHFKPLSYPIGHQQILQNWEKKVMVCRGLRQWSPGRADASKCFDFAKYCEYNLQEQIWLEMWTITQLKYSYCTMT